MKKTLLSEYLKANSQESLAQTVGLAQSAISKMKHSGRHISVVEHENGSIELLEEKKLSVQKQA